MNFTVYQVKLALLIFLGIYVVFGFIIIAISQITKSNITSALNSNSLNVDNLLSILAIDISLHAEWLLQSAFLPWGIVIIVLGFYGALSVILERRLLIKVFAFLLLIVASMKIPIIAYVSTTGTTETMTLYTKSDMLSTFEKSDSSQQAALAMNFIQNWHDCCGVNDYNDYKMFNVTEMAYPKSCCHDDSKKCYSSDEVKSDGCAGKVASAHASAFTTMSGMTIFVLLLEVFGTISAMYFPRLLLNRQMMLKGHSGSA